MSADPRQELAEFLRTRRTRLRPADVGFEPGPRRRVPGLRREELALLAGVSTDYYQRMEQAREVNPSPEVLDSLARALRFSAEESRHLHTLAMAARRPARVAPHRTPEAVPQTTLRLLETLPDPALVVSTHLDLLAWNPLAGALLGDFAALPRRRRNLLAVFLSPQADRTCPDRAATVAELTGMLRRSVAADPGHPRALELLTDLRTSAPEFPALWARHDVGETTRGRMRIDHPTVGELTLDWDAYPLPGAPGPMLLICTAEQHSSNEKRLRELAESTCG